MQFLCPAFCQILDLLLSPAQINQIFSVTQGAVDMILFVICFADVNVLQLPEKGSLGNSSDLI